jgi:holo-[acyl-carrier protein] synthase
VSAVGLDLLEIDRLERALERRPQLAVRLFTAGERAYAADRVRPAQHLAARFCAKEAVAKALRLTAWSWQDIEVVSAQDGPRVVLRGALADRAVDIDLSLTHTRGMAGAVALVRDADG